jgi:hypothetical protein
MHMFHHRRIARPRFPFFFFPSVEDDSAIFVIDARFPIPRENRINQYRSRRLRGTAAISILPLLLLLLLINYPETNWIR